MTIKEKVKQLDNFQWYMFAAALLFLITWAITRIRCNLIVALAFVFVIIAYKTTKKKKEDG